MGRERAQRWLAFLVALKGGVGAFYLPYPETSPLGIARGTVPKLDGPYTPGAETIGTHGWTPNMADILEAGELARCAPPIILHNLAQEASRSPLQPHRRYL